MRKSDFMIGADGRVWWKNPYYFNVDGNKSYKLNKYVGCVSKEDNEKYKLNGKEMMGGNTYIVEFDDKELQNWQRTKMMDKMLNG
jgi:hypothetical protein